MQTAMKEPETKETEFELNKYKRAPLAHFHLHFHHEKR